MKDKEMIKFTLPYCVEENSDGFTNYGYTRTAILYAKSLEEAKTKLKEIDVKFREFAKNGVIIEVPLEDSVVLTQEELEEKYEPSEKFMSFVRELEDLKQNLADKVVLSRRGYKELKHYESEMYRLQGVVDQLTNEGWDILDEKEEKIRQLERKETAEKILNEIYTVLWDEKTTTANSFVNLDVKIREIAIRERVEIKE